MKKQILLFFHALALQLQGRFKFDKKSLKKIFFINKYHVLSHDHFQRFHMNNVPFAEVSPARSIFQNYVHIVNVFFIGKCTKRNQQKSVLKTRNDY